MKGLTASAFSVLEDGVPQALDVVRPETMPATYTLLIDSSQSMARRIDFVREAAAGLVGHLRPEDRVVVAPFSQHARPDHRTPTDRPTVIEAIDSIESARRHGDSRSAREDRRPICVTRTAGTPSCS